MKFFSLDTLPPQSLGAELAAALGVVPGTVTVDKFANNETRVFVEEEVNGEVVVALFSGLGNLNERLLNYWLLLDALRRMGPRLIVAVMPWLPYSPQDKQFRSGEPISAELCARFTEASGADATVVVDLHSPLNAQFFQKPLYHLSALPLYIEHFRQLIDRIGGDNWTVVAFDKGATARSQEVAEALGLELVQLSKTRDRRTGAVSFASVEGRLQGKRTISFDDFVSTGSTRIQGTQLLRAQGVVAHYDAVTHVIVPETLAKIQQAESIDYFCCTNSTAVVLSKEHSKISQLNIAELISAQLKQIAHDSNH